MATNSKKQVEYLVADTTAFIRNAPLHEVAQNIITCKEVVDEITNKRQLRRLVVLPYDLIIKEVFPENIQIVTDFSKKTGDYPSLSATDIKVIALTYQLEKEKVGIQHLRTEPVLQRPIVNTENYVHDINSVITGFYLPSQDKVHDGKISPTQIQCNEKYSNKDESSNSAKSNEDSNINNTEELSVAELNKRFKTLQCTEGDLETQDDGLIPIRSDSSDLSNSDASSNDVSDEDEEAGWITPSNLKLAKKQVNSQFMEDKPVVVACMTTDFAMQNVLRQLNLIVSALDGKLITQLRTYILRCYSCFKTTSIMTKKFCPKCGNDTLKKVAVSVDEKGQMHIHINAKKPLTGRGKKFSLPRIKGGKHPNNPILVEDQPIPDNRPSSLARTKNNPLDDDYIAGFSPFIMRDVNSKSAQLGIRPGSEFKHWMRKNPNESRRRRK